MICSDPSDWILYLPVSCLICRFQSRIVIIWLTKRWSVGNLLVAQFPVNGRCRRAFSLALQRGNATFFESNVGLVVDDTRWRTGRLVGFGCWRWCWRCSDIEHRQEAGVTAAVEAALVLTSAVTVGAALVLAVPRVRAWCRYRTGALAFFVTWPWQNIPSLCYPIWCIGD